MIRRLFERLRGALRRRRHAREIAALGWLKARYHVFRVLLANNERALEAIAEADRLLRENEPARLAEVARDLRDTVLEIIDGLNRLTGNAHVGLYGGLARVAASLDQELERCARAPRRSWLRLAEVRPDMREQAGGKAEPLGALTRAGLPVPDGLCLTRGFCREFLRRGRLEGRLLAILRQAAQPGADLDALAASARGMLAACAPDAETMAELASAWEQLSANGAALSVRSSASSEDGGEHSFAGQYASVLGVRTQAAFVQAFKTVLASAFSPRALAYRIAAGLAAETVDMAVLCMRMVDARASGVLFTFDPLHPDSGRMLLTAVPGLGTLAVSGRAPADIFHPLRTPGDQEDTPCEIVAKTLREVPAPEAEGGGLRLEALSGPEWSLPLLAPAEVAGLRDQALRIEAMAGAPQDIEWAVDHAGKIWMLQARPARLARLRQGDGAAAGGAGGRVLLAGGVAAGPGKAAGRLAVARSRRELEAAAELPKPIVLALHQSLVDAAALAPKAAALLVDMGNPLDHLACLARELGIPMLVGLGTATAALEAGAWVLVDADRGEVRAADARLWQGAPPPAARAGKALGEAAAAVQKLIVPLNLTDAYGPTFNVAECRSLHDLVRYAHEKAVVALFEAGDAIAGETFSLVRRLRNPPGLGFLIIDLGGGLAPSTRTEIGVEDIRSEPLAALCRGMAAPGLRWGVPPPGFAEMGGLLTRGMLDKRSERPVGEPNYALVAQDYLNLNARVDFHFALIDAVCGNNARENSVRFRFKGGGTSRVQRERRALCVEEVLGRMDFFTARQGDMVTASFSEGPREATLDKVEMLGRLLGFSRLLDAVMVDDGMPRQVAEAFLSGDYALERLRPGGGS
jgi:pyruvate,water dikinase